MPIKPFETADAGAVMRLHAETFAGMGLDSFLWKPCQQIESLDADGPKYVFREGAEVTAYAAAYALDATHFRLNLIVAPSRTRRRLGTRLLDEIEKEVRRRGCLYLQARLLEAMPSSLAFALSRGFEEVHRMRGMTLRACDFDYGAWQPLGARLSAEGFRAATLKEERAAGGGHVEKLLEVHRLAQEGWAEPDPTWRPEDTARRRAVFEEVRSPELFTVMKFGEVYVGYTSAARANMVGTAVRPDFRGRGVATYMKACNLRACIAAGEEHFETSSANPAMLRVNEKLGYRLNGLAEVRLLKRLQKQSL
jgi:GNAT superfamily N-acetyltransferase